MLGVLYESFIHPVTILSTLPSAGVGALLALIITGHDLNIVSIIGIILLIGIVKKNAIMMIDFALEAERNEGKSPTDAIHQAALLRFRPILMTTVAALFGALPLMLGSRHGLGAAPSPGHFHRRRPAGQPASHPVHHAGDLHLFRPLGPGTARMARPPARRGPRLTRRDRGQDGLALHPPPHRHHPSGAGPGAGRAGRVLPAAGVAAAQHRHSHHRGQASMAGASPETMSTSVATPLERHLGAIAAVTEMTSRSRVGSTQVVLQFDISRDIDGAARDVQAAISAARADLPAALRSNPSYRKFNPARFPHHDPGADLQDLDAGPDLRPGLQHPAAAPVPGAGRGRRHADGRRRCRRCASNSIRRALFKYGIGLEDVRAAISSANAGANSPKGAIEQGDQRIQIYSNDNADQAADFKNLIVAYRNNAAVRLSGCRRCL